MAHDYSLMESLLLMGKEVLSFESLEKKKWNKFSWNEPLIQAETVRIDPYCGCSLHLHMVKQPHNVVFLCVITNFHPYYVENIIVIYDAFSVPAFKTVPSHAIWNGTANAWSNWLD